MKIEVQCLNCTKTFQKSEREIRLTNNRNFCSRKCSASAQHGVQRNPPKIRKCKKCGGDYTCANGYRSEAYCNFCRSTNDHKLDTLEQIHASLHLKGKHPSWINAQVRSFNRQWNKNLLKLPCACCGYSLHVELCHKKPVSKFPKNATLGEINHPSNVVQLCRNHHWELDHGLLLSTRF